MNVQGVLLHNNQVLTIQCRTQGEKQIKTFIHGDKYDNENSLQAIRREFHEQLGIKLEEEPFLMERKGSGTTTHTFLFKITDEQREAISQQKLKSLSPKLTPFELEWRSLEEKRGYRHTEAYTLKMLLLKGIQKGLDEKWMKIIEENYYNTEYDIHTLQFYKRRRMEKELDMKTSDRDKLTVIIFAVGIGVLIEYMLLWHNIGISAILLTTIFLAGFHYCLRGQLNHLKRESFIFLIPLLALASSFALYNNEFLRFLNVCGLPILIVLYTLSVMDMDHLFSFRGVRAIVERSLSKPFQNYGKLSKVSYELHKAHSTNKHRVRKDILIGLLIALPIFIILLFILASADPIFNHYIKSLLRLIEDLDLLSYIGKTITVIVIGSYVFGYVWSIRYRQFASGEVKKDVKPKGKWSPVISMTVLTSINLLYLVFTCVQARYLYNVQGVLPLGLTYSQYATKGFTELIFVAHLNFGLLALFYTFTKTGQGKMMTWLKGCYSALILFTFNMLVSSIYKMFLYEKAYGFTELRVFTQFFLVFLAGVMVLAFLYLWNNKIRVVKYSFVIGIVMYTYLNLMNVDHFIAKQNIDRYEQGEKIDIEYIKSLSIDAIPQLERLLEDKNVVTVRNIRDYIVLERDLLANKYDSWYEFNVNKQRLMGK